MFAHRRYRTQLVLLRSRVPFITVTYKVTIGKFVRTVGLLLTQLLIMILAGLIVVVHFTVKKRVSLLGPCAREKTGSNNSLSK